MRPLAWPDEWETVLLAKSAAKGAGGQPESLVQHTWLVLLRLAELIRLRPRLPHQLQQPRLWHCLYWATFLHDFGKVMPGFQGVLRGDRQLKEQWAKNRHELFSLAFLDWINDGFNEQERLWVAAGIVAHHRDRAEIIQLYPTLGFGDEREDPLYAHLELLSQAHVSGLYRWLVDCGWAWAQTLRLDELGVENVAFAAAPMFPFAPYAVKTIRYWLNAYDTLVDRLQRPRFAGWTIPLLTLRGLIINADHSASAHAPSFPTITFSAQDVLESQQIDQAKLFDHQRQASEKEGSALMIAPTGSGKTEAALLWAARQISGEHASPRLFYTLPYQASMNAMNRRLKETFDRHGIPHTDDNQPLSYVGLQHGRSLLALHQYLMEQEYDTGEATRHARAIRDLNKLNFPPVRVFSPYQMLKGMYRLKGYETQLADYHNALFVFDEIHAYEVKRLALILQSMAYLRRHYQARFFIMSATFPTLIKGWLKEALALGEDAEIKAAASLFETFQRHRLKLISGDLLHHLEQIAFSPEQSILVVCNTVGRAQEVFQWLNANTTGKQIELLHGNFNLRHRLAKEKLVQEFTGSKSEYRQPIILVATQVVEVSLDIDLATIYTDPAPLEALVQRFGRVNRGRKMKNLAPVHIFTEPDDGQGIYDPRLISRTLEVLQQADGQPIVESKIGEWLDEIYAGEIATEWQKCFSDTAHEFEQAIINSLRPFQSDRALVELFYQAFDGVDVLPEDLLSEYDSLIQEHNYIEARQLMISITHKRLYSLKSKRLAWKEGDKWIVALPYDDKVGLHRVMPEPATTWQDDSI
ncbi:MAG: CRISPR-associated helicase Cas3' [Anaerolineae bacterium]|nr:CRISPR-associated helicase Cas3' [Anaerolineae bacterium]